MFNFEWIRNDFLDGTLKPQSLKDKFGKLDFMIK